MVAQTHILLAHAEGEKEVLAVVLPVIEPLKVGVGLAEEFALHLLELPDTENEVSGCDLVSEGLSHLADAEGKLFSCGALDVREVYEYALRSLRTEVDLAL